MKQRFLGGSADRWAPRVSEIGFGGWALGGQWGPQQDSDSLAALHAAIDAGVNFIDTAAGYGDGHSERLVAKAVRERSEEVFVATKTPPADGPWPPSPYCRWEDRYGAVYLRENVEQRLRSLGTEQLDLLQLHSWTRAWNDDPQPLLVLRRLREEGKINLIGVCTPEQDQNSVIDLMRNGLVDVVQVVFNIFEQEAAAQLFSVAAETNTGVIVRVPLDEGSLSGKYSGEHTFAADDFRSRYFAGDRMQRTAERVEAIRDDIRRYDLPESVTLADVAIKFALSPPEVSTVIVGVRTPQQAACNAAVSEMPELPEGLIADLRRRCWLRGFWYSGK